MATLADELLNDFEESGSDGEEEKQNDFVDYSNAPPSDVTNSRTEEMDMAIDEEGQGKDNTNEKLLSGIQDADDAEEAKSQVEKMQLGQFTDVRRVTTLKERLEPVLKVSSPHGLSTPRFDISFGLHLPV